MARRIAALLALVVMLAACGSPAPVPTPETTTSADASPTARPSASASPSVAPSASPSPSPSPSGEMVAGIDGVLRPAELARRTPIAVLIDDAMAARPQSGYNAAALVYQAPADGGEDRYMFVYQADEAKDVGPVRSGRPFFIRWAAEYRAAVSHYGGDYMTLGQTIPELVKKKLIYDIDALSGEGAAFHRIRTRRAPHNAYTDTVSLRKMGSRRAMPAAQPSTLAARAYVEDAPLAERPATSTIKVPYPRGSADYTYDRERNLYLRSVAGKAQVDAADGQRVTARNVVVLFMKKSIDPNSEPGHARVVLDQIGSGKALVFREGRAWPATWKKENVAAMTRLYDAAGKEIPLVRGRTFFQVVPTGTKVTYKAAAGS